MSALLRGRSRGSGGLLGYVRTMAAEDAGRNELAELVPDHVLGDVDGQELVPVVPGQRVADELREDRAAPRPGLEHPLLAAPVERLDLADQAVDDVRPLLDRTCHRLARLPLLLPSAHDELVAQLRLAGLESLADLPPRRAGMPPAGGLAFAAAHRVVDRVHRHAPDARQAPQPAGAPGLAERDVLVIQVAHLPDHRAAVDVKAPHRTRRQPELRVVAVLRHELAERARRARHPGVAAREQLDVVDVGAERDVLERQAVARLDLGVRTGLDELADPKAVGRDDVAALAVHIVEEGDARRAVRVVLDARHPRRDSGLVAAEVHQTVALLVAAADPARRHVSVVVTAAGLELALGERLDRLAARELGEVGQCGVPAGRGDGSEFPERHGPGSSWLDLLEQLDLLLGPERDDRLLPIAALALVAALPLDLAAHLHGTDLVDLDGEDGLDRAPDLDLVGVAGDFEVVLVAKLAQRGALLGDERLADDAAGIPHRANTSFMRSRLSRVRSSMSQFMRS